MITLLFNANTNTEFFNQQRNWHKKRLRRSQFSFLFQFLEQSKAAQVWLPVSVLPQYQQVVGWACDQTVLPKAHKHLLRNRNRTVRPSMMRDYRQVWQCTWTAPECPMRSPVNSRVLRFDTSAAFFDEEPACLLGRPRVHIPKKPSCVYNSGLEVKNTCVCVCACVCERPGEAGSAAKGKSWISHILTLPSSEQDISSLHQRPR